MNNIRIRELNISDKSEVREFAQIHESVPAGWTTNFSLSQERLERRIDKIQSSKDSYFLVAVNKEEKLVGIYWAYLTEKWNDKVLHIGSLWVDKDYRKQGISKKLMKLGDDWAKQNSAVLSLLNVHFNNSYAIEYYQRNGFIPGFLEMIREYDIEK